MIVIKATGSTDVRALKKLARTLSAEPVDVIPDEPQDAPARRKQPHKPTVSPIGGAVIAPAAQGAIMELGARAAGSGAPEAR